MEVVLEASWDIVVEFVLRCVSVSVALAPAALTDSEGEGEGVTEVDNVTVALPEELSDLDSVTSSEPLSVCDVLNDLLCP